jgi:nanoRNase/pAp phosphatase (c-di-AMP/oligoRNAs hydrolase)
MAHNTRKSDTLLKFLATEKTRLSPLLVLTHDFPDPDALASAWALQYIAQNRFGIRTRIAYGGVIGRYENKEMSRRLRLPVHKLRSGDLERYTNIALVDTQPTFENNTFPKKRRASVVIDQHPFVHKPDADFMIIDTDAGATSVILARVMLLNEIEIPSKLATALVYGILSDTLNLYKVRRQEIITTYLSLLPMCDIRALSSIQNALRSRKFFGELVTGIQQAMIRERLIVSHLGKVGNPDLVSQMADFLLTCEGMHWSFCSGRLGDNLHISLRTANPEGRAGVVLRDIFHNAGRAGGHGRIAGGKLKVGKNKGEHVWAGTEHLLTQRLAKRLRLSGETHFRPFIKERKTHSRRIQGK